MAVVHLVGLHPDSHPEGILAKESRVQCPRPLFLICARRIPHSHHLVGNPLFLFLLRCRQLRCALCHGPDHIPHFGFLCPSRMDENLFYPHRPRCSLWSGDFGHACGNGCPLERNVSIRRPVQELEKHYHQLRCSRCYLFLFLFYDDRQ